VERSRPRPRVPRATEGAVEYTIHSPQKMGTGVDGTYFVSGGAIGGSGGPGLQCWDRALGWLGQ
jgi:hypothetical protein